MLKQFKCKLNEFKVWGKALGCGHSQYMRPMGVYDEVVVVKSNPTSHFGIWSSTHVLYPL